MKNLASKEKIESFEKVTGGRERDRERVRKRDRDKEKIDTAMHISFHLTFRLYFVLPFDINTFRCHPRNANATP